MARATQRRTSNKTTNRNRKGGAPNTRTKNTRAGKPTRPESSRPRPKPKQQSEPVVDLPRKLYEMGEYHLLDSGNQQKLEKLGNYTLVRPALQAVWQPKLSRSMWQQADAIYTRDNTGAGQWNWNKKIDRDFDVLFGDMSFHVKLTNFGHMGLFAEQAENWSWLREKIRSRMWRTNNSNLHVLNLFAYTGGSTLAASQAGAHVLHLDAAKGVVDWGRKNAQLCRLDERPIRWIVDDALKFMEREVRRGHKYQGIILDPPSFGRGPKGEVFKIEKDLFELLDNVKALLARDALFVLYSCHTPGFTPITMSNQLGEIVSDRAGSVETGEMTIAEQGGRLLPSGVFARWSEEEPARGTQKKKESVVAQGEGEGTPAQEDA